uniref:Rieske domain-containing protein n=1 Tax=Desulfomonile tiedjei TaxID=2358 RepID=A0A7C4ARE9_9BACT
MTKRSFLKTFLLFCSGLFSLATVWGAGRFAAFGFAVNRKRELPRDVFSRVEEGSPLHVADAGVWLVKTRDHEAVTVLDDKCPHLGCKPNWNPSRRVFECPCHGSEFDAQGFVKKGPASKRMIELYLEEENASTFKVSERPSSRQ